MRPYALALIPLTIAACTDPTGGSSTTTAEGGTLTTLPESVIALAAPYQDLSTVRTNESGCYVYLYAGPVETTWLPLRSREGRPICTQAQASAAAAG